MNPFKKCVKLIYVQNFNIFAGVMELADVTDSKSVGSNTVWVRVPPPAPKREAKKDIGDKNPVFSRLPRPVDQ